jgi:hypothetical protein
MCNINIFVLLLHKNFFTLHRILFVDRNTFQRPSKALLAQYSVLTTCPQIQDRYTSYWPLKPSVIFHHFLPRRNVFPIGNHLDRPCSSKSTAQPELTVAAKCCFAQLTASLSKHHVHCYGKQHHVQFCTQQLQQSERHAKPPQLLS